MGGLPSSWTEVQRYRGAISNVRFGSKADICAAKSHVRFTPKSGHVRCKHRCPLGIVQKFNRHATFK